jgi:flagellar biosynthesis protein FlhG
MADQAEKLRTLRETSLAAAHLVPEALSLVVLSGARPGVGTTTVAINLAAALADRGDRVLVVDASERPNNLRGVAGIRNVTAHSLADVLVQRAELLDAVIDGPMGTSLLAGPLGMRNGTRGERNLSAKLLLMLAQASRQFDVILVDAGSGLSQTTRRLWLRSQLVLLTTTAEDASVMDAYRMLKLAAANKIRPQVALLLNRAEGEGTASETHHRIAASCRKFLEWEVAGLPSLSQDSGPIGKSPRVWEDPSSQFGHEALWLGRAVGDLLAEKIAGGRRESTRQAASRGAQAVSC